MNQSTIAYRPAQRWPIWLRLVIVSLVILNGLPFLAPLFMKLGWATLGQAIYIVYGQLCHQMAQRSFFLFGPAGFQMYNIADLPVDAAGPAAHWVLRRFLGNDSLGWKVAWSDRMVSMYLSPLLVALVYAVARRFRRIQPLPLWGFGLLLLPMILDGGAHMISDTLQGIGQGFRDNNAWLAAMTGNIFPHSFYAGDALGSFNSLIRLLSGLTFGIAIGWLLFPYIDLSLDQPKQALELPTAGAGPALPTLDLTEKR